jgi:nucleoside-diphosphate-sugar epimerase
VSTSIGLPFTTINVGSSRHHTVRGFIETVFDVVGWRPTDLELQTWRPVGVASRASDNARILELCSWEPEVGLVEGITNSVNWYSARSDRPASVTELDALLLARGRPGQDGLEFV